jgi:hypothetical protein
MEAGRGVVEVSLLGHADLPQHSAHPLGSVDSRGEVGMRCQPSAETM